MGANGKKNKCLVIIEKKVIVFRNRTLKAITISYLIDRIIFALTNNLEWKHLSIVGDQGTGRSCGLGQNNPTLPPQSDRTGECEQITEQPDRL